MPNVPFLPPDELSAAVLDAAEALVVANGPEGLALRRVAAEVGCSVGTVYNAVGGIDEIVAGLNARTMGRLNVELAACAAGDRTPTDRVLALAACYLDFVAANVPLWRVLMEWAGSRGARPSAFSDKLAGAVAIVDGALKPLLPEAGERGMAVGSLWASLQGLASLSASGKLNIVGSAGAPGELARFLISRFLAGAVAPLRPAE